MNKLEAEQNKSDEAVGLQETPEQALLLCPFCGGEPIRIKPLPNPLNQEALVRCNNQQRCPGATTSAFVSEWNTRADAAQQGTIAALVEALHHIISVKSESTGGFHRNAARQLDEIASIARAALQKAEQQ